MEFFTSLGMLITLIFAIVGSLWFTVWVWRKAFTFANGECLWCNGNGGEYNLLLIFSRHSWEECRKCNGTGKR